MDFLINEHPDFVKEELKRIEKIEKQKQINPNKIHKVPIHCT